ncbi:MAG: tyrosine-type recombinase/integrase [Alphaproteobacteria bacterium]|jgi:integrase|nr:tyrosine-type recombinase/integrase [Alphaproteobacteria bacterium]MBT4543548.1 tyrosine-type recombinase/integrase [Alphaproteobacteria bacterium]
MAMLKNTEVKNAKPGKHHDGAGLYLVASDKSKKWVQRGTVNGRRREWGLGVYPAIGLADARNKAALYRKLISEGIDPSDERKRLLAEAAAKAASTPTFEEVAREVYEANAPGWKNPKHQQQWINTLTTYAFPKIGGIPVDEVSTSDVLTVLQSIWMQKEETARRLRQRISVVIDYAVAKEWRDLPLHMAVVDKALPKQKKKVKNHLALDYANIPKFFTELGKLKTNPRYRLALEFTILVALRSSEVRLATWKEFDLNNQLWTIPASRMKMDQEHVVPLSDRAMEILEVMELGSDDEYVFKGSRSNGQPYSDATLLQVLKRMKLGITVHGFRSTFRDWVSEETEFPDNVAEMALAHTISNKSEAAYRRGKLLKKRRDLMESWARYCHSATQDNVTALRAVK